MDTPTLSAQHSNLDRYPDRVWLSPLMFDNLSRFHRTTQVVSSGKWWIFMNDRPRKLLKVVSDTIRRKHYSYFHESGLWKHSSKLSEPQNLPNELALAPLTLISQVKLRLLTIVHPKPPKDYLLKLWIWNCWWRCWSPALPSKRKMWSYRLGLFSATAIGQFFAFVIAPYLRSFLYFKQLIIHLPDSLKPLNKLPCTHNSESKFGSC